MKIYHERLLICDCGKSQRQTANTIPLDKVGQALSDMQERDFSYGHRCKQLSVSFTEWKTIKDFEDN